MSLEFSPMHGIRDRPSLDRNHQSSVSGLYVIGDLADAPIIAAALQQGRTVAEHVATTLVPEAEVDHDVLIVGGGPAGISAAMRLAELGVDHAVAERETSFATIANFPTGKMIYTEHEQTDDTGTLSLIDGPKETLVARWRAALEDTSVTVLQPAEVMSATPAPHGFDVVLVENGRPRTVRTQKVILAAGKRGEVNRLEVPGGDLPHVHHALGAPEAHAGQAVLVIGGGDTAVETAMLLCHAGAQVTLSYRGSSFDRPNASNRTQLSTLERDGKLRILRETVVAAVAQDVVTLRTHDGDILTVPADHVYAMIGTHVPFDFLRRLGIRLRGDLRWTDALWAASFTLLVYVFYCLKSGQLLFPFGPQDPLHWMHAALKVDLGFRQTTAAFWGTAVYAIVILVFGLRALRHHKSPAQQRRYWSLIGFQWLFLFGIPEIIAPLVIERPWKLYALSVPWPLSIWSLLDGPAWTDGDAVTAMLWVGLGAFTSFVLIPLYVRRNGERFCSYLCGCGGLAETLGDFWRHLAPRGRHAKDAEVFGRIIFLLAIPVTLLILNDAWAFFASDALYNTKAFAQHWYGLMVDFWLASVIGVALYPYLGNRVWCRFFCPLRAYMEAIARRFSRLVIQSDDRCISCGECTLHCQMGIQVERFAQRQIDLSNINSSCIQCGICIEVCPMDVLSVGTAGQTVELGGGILGIPRAPWER